MTSPRFSGQHIGVSCWVQELSHPMSGPVPSSPIPSSSACASKLWQGACECSLGSIALTLPLEASPDLPPPCTYVRVLLSTRIVAARLNGSLDFFSLETRASFNHLQFRGERVPGTLHSQG